MRFVAAAVMVLAAAPAAAQQAPVSGYVIDLRGATSGLPNSTAYFPGIPSDTTVPARGFGFDLGAHVYLVKVGPSRVGFGANYAGVRGTVPGIVTNLRTLAPQVSFNFGGRNGWSYLSAGIGRAWIRTGADTGSGTETAETGGISAVNVGGGARWFLNSRIAVGFDLRLHRIDAPQRTSTFSAAVGFSVR